MKGYNLEKIVLSAIICEIATMHENKKYLLELKESLLILRDRPSMYQSVRSALLYLFQLVHVTVFAVHCLLSFLLIVRKLSDLKKNCKF